MPISENTISSKTGARSSCTGSTWLIFEAYHVKPIFRSPRLRLAAVEVGGREGYNLKTLHAKWTERFLPVNIEGSVSTRPPQVRSAQGFMGSWPASVMDFGRELCESTLLNLTFYSSSRYIEGGCWEGRNGMIFQWVKSIARQDNQMCVDSGDGVAGLLISCDFEHIILCASSIKCKHWAGLERWLAAKSTHSTWRGSQSLCWSAHNSQMNLTLIWRFFWISMLICTCGHISLPHIHVIICPRVGLFCFL